MSYRPHNSGHDYYDKGIYLITLVVGNRDRLLGELNMDVHNPSVSLSSLGSAVMDEWRKTAAIQASKDRRITRHAAVCMPDYFHGVIEVGERMDVSIGNIILFKGTLFRERLSPHPYPERTHLPLLETRSLPFPCL